MFSFSKESTLPTYECSTTETLMKNTSNQCDSTVNVRSKASHGRRNQILIALILALLLLSSVTINIYFISRPNSASLTCDSADQSNRVCLSCKYFQDGENFLWKNDAQNRLDENVTKENDVCCFHYTESLHRFYQTIFLQHLSPGTTHAENDHRPAAHLTLNATASKQSPLGLRWNIYNDGADTSFMKHVGYADDKMMVLEAGTYYVYSFITFRSAGAGDDFFLNHYMYRDNGNQERDSTQMVFMDKQTRKAGNLEYQTSFLAGTLKLDSRDRVYTGVSDVAAVYGSPLANYMGLFRL